VEKDSSRLYEEAFSAQSQMKKKGSRCKENEGTIKRDGREDAQRNVKSEFTFISVGVEEKEENNLCVKNCHESRFSTSILPFFSTPSDDHGTSVAAFPCLPSFPLTMPCSFLFTSSSIHSRLEVIPREKWKNSRQIDGENN